MKTRTGLIAVFFLVLSSSLFSQEKMAPQEKDVTYYFISNFLQGKGSTDVLIYVSNGVYQEQAPSAEEIKRQYGEAQIFLHKSVGTGPSSATVAARTISGPNKIVEHHTFTLVGAKGSWKVLVWHKSSP